MQDARPGSERTLTRPPRIAESTAPTVGACLECPAPHAGTGHRCKQQRRSPQKCTKRTALHACPHGENLRRENCEKCHPPTCAHGRPETAGKEGGHAPARRRGQWGAALSSRPARLGLALPHLLNRPGEMVPRPWAFLFAVALPDHMPHIRKMVRGRARRCPDHVAGASNMICHPHGGRLFHAKKRYFAAPRARRDQ
jgi:hypothetical protein